MGLFNRTGRTARSTDTKGGEFPLFSPRGLLRAAGLTSDRPSVEALEARQLLFTLTVTADNVDPATGIGTVQAFFAYGAPLLLTSRQRATEPPTPQTRTEPFNDEAYGQIGSGTFLLESNVQVVHTGIEAAIEGRFPPGDTVDNQARYLRADLANAADRISFRFFGDADQDTGQRPRLTAVTAALQIIGVTQLTANGQNATNDPTGLVPSRHRVELRLRDQVLATFTGAALQALLTPTAGTNPANGVGTFNFQVPGTSQQFDEIRIIALDDAAPNGGISAFGVDSLSYTRIQTVNKIALDPTIGAAGITLAGPVGASVTLTDLYGRDMDATLGMGVVNGSDVLQGDPDDDGRWDINAGIGAIRFSGVDTRTTFSMWGGTIQQSDVIPNDAAFYEVGTGLAFFWDDSLNRFYDDLEQAGVGFGYNINGDEIDVTGLPDGPGTVFVGSAFIRDYTRGGNWINGVYDPGTVDIFGPAVNGQLVLDGFNRADQGVFVENGQSIGSIHINGVVMGSSHISGTIQTFAAGYMLGSLTVDGDIGTYVSGTDAGMWAPDPNFVVTTNLNLEPVYKTGGQLIVGRTVGQINIGGRSLLDVTVVGDLNLPGTRPPRSTFIYSEQEHVLGVPTTTTPRAAIDRNLTDNSAPFAIATTDLFRFSSQAYAFGPGGFFRNDTLSSSEFVGSASTGVRIRGEISGLDPFNNGEDKADVYGFAVDGTNEIVIQGVDSRAGGLTYFRVVDSRGRTVAAPEGFDPADGQRRFDATTLRFTPTEGAGVYYLVVMDPTGDNGTTSTVNQPYSVLITGMASTTLGAYRTGGGSGFASGNTVRTNTVAALSGSIGSIRVGMGFGDGTGGDANPADAYNTALSDDDSASFSGGVFTSPGTIYNITTGGDIGVPNGDGTGRVEVRAAGNLGSLVTGINPAISGGVGDGDVNMLYLSIGGSIGSMDISGGIGMDQDSPADPRGPLTPTGGLSITTGTSGGRGDIGSIRTGFHIAADLFRVHVPAGSQIGQLLVSQDSYGDTNPRSGLYDGASGLPISSGSGSDIRFVDFPRIDTVHSDNELFTLVGDQSREFVDDAGVRFSIQVTGVAAGVVAGTVRVLPIDNSLGVAVAQISVNLAGGRGLKIEPLSGDPDDVVSIGRIIVTAADAGSTIEIGSTSGPEFDVYRIDVNGALDGIFNRSINGDILTIDAIALTNLEVRGNLGFTQTVPFGPTTYAARLGIAGDGPVNALGGAMGIVATAGRTVDNDYNGAVYRPLNDDNWGGGTAYLDDIGMPLDEYANGLVLRTGNIARIAVDGQVGDVILQDTTAAIVDMAINTDRVTPFDGFDGLLGVIYAFDIGTLDIGDGIARRTNDTPIGTTGVFVGNNILNITANASNGTPYIGGVISSANLRARGDDGELLLPEQADGIDSINIRNGLIDDAFIGVSLADDYWRSFRQYDGDLVTPGDIGSIDMAGSRIFRSQVRTRNVTNILFQGGTWDATALAVTENVGTIAGDNVRNSTLAGDVAEFHPNSMFIGRDIESLTILRDIADLTFNAVGDVRQTISATNLVRGTYNIAGIVHGMRITQDIRASRIEAGELESIQLTGDLTGSTLSVSGAIQTLNVESIRNSLIEVTGPGGSIGTITARALFHGEVRSTGPVGTLTSTTNNVNIKLVTTGTNASVQAIRATVGDVILDADVAGSITSITAGRNIGSPTQRVGAFILAHENIGTVAAPNGQLYNDLRASGTIGTVTLGRADSKPGSDRVGRGSIVSQNRIQGVTLNGDFGGDIISYTGGIGNVTVNNGSLYLGRIVAAFDGSIDNLSITGGDLLASVYADYDITNLTITQDAGRVFGNVGIDPAKNQFNSVAGDALRNQLPSGVAQDSSIQGPRIEAGRDIRNVTIGGSVFESGFVAGRAITAVNIGGRIANDQFSAGRKGTFFAAGDSITSVTVAQSVADAQFLAGITGLGADNRPGGIGTNADTVKSGSIGTINAQATFGVSFLAGVAAGSDGVYATTDDKQSIGNSSITTLTIPLTVSNTQIEGDLLSAAIKADARFSNGAVNTPTNWRAELLSVGVDANQAIPGTSFSGTQAFVSGTTTYTFTFSGPGTAIYNAGTNRLVLRNTTSASNLTVASNTGFVDNMTIVTNDESSLGTLNFTSTLRGATSVLVDGGIGTITVAGSVFARNSLGNIDTTNTPRITAGGDVSTFTATSWNGGFITTRAMGTFRVNGEFGGAPETGEASLQALSLGSANVTGATRALISIDRDSGAINLTGAVDRTQVRVGGSLSGLTTGALSQTVIAVYDTLGNVQVNGQMFDSAIAAGVDTGTDAAFDGTGTAADRLSTGFIGTVTIGGDFRESDITAGFLRGPDKFFGTRDDRIAAGRSTIGNVTIAGSNVGSARASESYRIASSGTLGQVRVGGQTFTGTRNNFSVETRVLPPVPVRVEDISVAVDALIYTAQITFNQLMDISSLSSALSVSEVRGEGDIEIRLIEGVDYTLSYTEASNTLNVTFDRDILSRGLPQVPGLPGPGVYRFRLSEALTRGRLTRMPLDGNGNGVIEVQDTYSQDIVVGDAGDKLVAQTLPLINGAVIDFYEPANLDFVFDDNRSPDGLPDPNRTLVISGAIGDHPDNDANNFRFTGDVDLYSITLQAGQILRLSSITGAAFAAPVSLLDANGNAIGAFGLEALAVSLPAAAVPLDAPATQTQPTAFLIRQTGTYILAVGNAATVANPTAINNTFPTNDGQLGAYSLEFTIFDDGDSGFTSSTDAGDGTSVVNAPAPVAFAGLDNTLGTSDDPASIIVADYTFTYSSGADGLVNTADDVVTGTNDMGVTSTTTAAGRSTSLIQSAIGPADVAGVVSGIASDVDIFHLNNRQPITPGTKMRATVRLTDLGSDLGSQAVLSNSANRGTVQIGLFDTSNSIAADDATVVFSPSEFIPYGGEANTVLADNGTTKYGFDANGDFYIEFVAPERLGAPAQAGTFALYIQGIINSSYEIEVVTQGTGTITKTTQNIFIETTGGSVDWLEVGGITTKLTGFNPALLGFTGSTLSGQPVGEYLVTRLVSSLNALFQGAGLDVNFSTNPADFEFQPFSTIYLSNQHDPINQIFKSFLSFNFQNLNIFDSINEVFSSTQPFGASQRSDPFNTSLEDESVVFAPAFAILGLTPSQSDIDQFVTDLTGALARRTGEMMGLRITADNIINNIPALTYDPMAADSVATAPTGNLAYVLSDQNRALSNPQDSIESTDFFLGRQRAFSLLNQIVRGS